MPRVMCVWFPKWPIQRLRNERPELRRSELVLFAAQAQRPLVTLCTSRAERQGVRAGLPLSEAKALLPRAVFLPADDPADLAALRQLALECQRFSPLVGLEDGPQAESLLCNIDGCTHLWECEAQFLEHVWDYWQDRGYDIQLALAGSLGAAWALAHTAPFSLVPAGEEVSALSSLPVETLRLPSTVLDRLQTLGLGTIGDVLRLPRESLAARLGMLLPQRLDQVLGLRPESFLPQRLVQPLCTVREWEVPIDDRLNLVVLCRQMLHELLSMADRHGMGLQELEGEFQTEGGPVTMALRLTEPTRNIGHLEKLLELQFERHAWSGGVTSVRWAALRLGRIEAVQGCWFEDESEVDQSRTLNALVDRLNSRLDANAVLRVEVLPDAQPECVARLVPWTNMEVSKVDPFILPPELSRGRPLRLLVNPETLDVSSIVPDGPPIHALWRGRGYPVIRVWGPERIATGWWRGPDVERDYYRTEWDDGTHAWIYRDRRTGRWFLHGFFD
jgi:protein ImuB